MGRGDEGAHAVDVGQQTALDRFTAHGVYQFTGFVFFHQRRPHLAVDDIALGEDDVAFTVIDFDDFNLDLITKLDVLVYHLVALEQPIRLVVDVDADFVIRNLDDFACDRLAGADAGHAGSHFVHEAGFGLGRFLSSRLRLCRTFGGFISRRFLSICGFFHGFFRLFYSVFCRVFGLFRDVHSVLGRFFCRVHDVFCRVLYCLLGFFNHFSNGFLNVYLLLRGFGVRVLSIEFHVVHKVNNLLK